MITRIKTPYISEILKQFPVTAIIGPRQCGKTTLARLLETMISKPTIYLDLELSSDLNKLSDPEFFLNLHQEHCVIIDEIQRMPALFPLIRALVDRDRIAGRFLILGSVSPSLIKNASESLAGRIGYVELSPFCLGETGPSTFQKLWVRGGFPDSFLADNELSSQRWRTSFIRTYLERDIPQQGIRIPAESLRRFWTMLAHVNGQILNLSRLSASLGQTPPTARHYLDILKDTFIVRLLEPFSANIGKRLIKSPKVYIRDSGLLHTLLGLGDLDHILSNPGAGASWEGFVLEQISAILPEFWQMYYYRTGGGAELDLVLTGPGDRRIGVEIKLSSAPVLSKGFYQSVADLEINQSYVVYPGSERYPLKPGVICLPLAEIATIFS